jgi:hypothetical protein
MAMPYNAVSVFLCHELYCLSCRLVCSDYEKTVQDIGDNHDKNFDPNNSHQAAVLDNMASQLDFPASTPVTTSDIAVCARSWRWEWFAMFFQFVIVAAALVVTMCPKRLLRARFPLAVMLAIATVVIVVSC